MEGNGVRMTADSRVYLLSKEVSTLSPDAFWQVNLDEQHFTYDLNLSGVPCHCNAAGYFIKMPAPNAGGGGDYYCDANYVGGQGCPEYDTLESNKHIVTGALHNCGWDGSWYSGCDGGGCGGNSWDSGASFCPGGCTINSDQEFGSLTIRTPACPTPTWSKMDRESALTFAVMVVTSTTWVSITMGWCSLCHFGVDLA